MSSSYTHGSQLARGIQIEWLSAVWMVIEAVAAIFAGVMAHSIALIAFGADSVIELVAGGALLFRLYVDANGGDSERVERAEGAASWIVGIALLALAAYIVVSSAVSLFTQSHPEAAPLGIGDCGGVEHPHAVSRHDKEKSRAAYREQGACIRRGMQYGVRLHVVDTSCWRRCDRPAWVVVGGCCGCPWVCLVRHP